MTKEANTIKYEVNQANPYIQDCYGILYGTDKDNLKHLWVDKPKRLYSIFASDKWARRYISGNCPTHIDDKKIHYKTILLRAFYAELIPVEVKANEK
jgi:hypothetical protein